MFRIAVIRQRPESRFTVIVVQIRRASAPVV